MKKWIKKKKPRVAPLVILDTPLKGSISKEVISEVVRFAIMKWKGKNPDHQDS
jgi:hypothetical protein